MKVAAAEKNLFYEFLHTLHLYFFMYFCSIGKATNNFSNVFMHCKDEGKEERMRERKQTIQI